MLTQLLRSGAIYAVANILAAGVPFLLLPVLTRALSPSEYGEVVSFFMLVPVSAAVAGLSLHGAVGVRWLDHSRGDPRSFTGTAVAIVIVSTAFASGLAAVLGPAVGVDLKPEVCALAAVMAGSLVLQGMRFAVWQSRDQALPAAALQVASAVLNVGLSLVAVFILHWGGLGRVVGAVVAGVLVASFSVASLHRNACAGRPTSADATALVRFGLPLVPHALAGALLASLDRFAVSAQLGVGALGVYGAASQLGLVINVFADAATKAFTPQMYRMLTRNTPRTRLRLVAITYLSIPAWLCAACLLWAAFVLCGGVLLGERYREAIDLAIWFLLGGALSGAYLNVAGLFFFTGKTEWMSLATLSACVVAAAVAPLAVARQGTHGAAAAYCIAQAALLIAAWVLSGRVKPMPWSRPVLALRVLSRHRGSP